MTVETQTYKGYWWLLDNPEKKVSGILTVSRSKGIELKTIGSLINTRDMWSEKQGSVSRDLLLGLASNNASVFAITLVKTHCIEQDSPQSTNDWALDLSTATHSAEVALVGKRHFSDIDDITFSSVSSEFSLLNEWLCASGLSRKDEYDAGEYIGSTISYQRPTPLEFDVKAIEAKIKIAYGHQSSTRYGDWFFKYQSSLRLSPDLPQTLEWFSKQLESLRKFLILMTGFPLTTKGMIGETDDVVISESSQETKETFNIYFNSSRSFKDTSEKHPLTLLTNTSKLEGQLSTILNSWFQKAEILEPAVILCTANMAIDLVYSEFYLLNYAQALESLHRRRFGGKYKQNNRITMLLDEVWDDCLEHFIKDKKTFIRELDGTRNYVVHFDPNEHAKVVYGTGLFYLGEQVKVLLLTQILLQLCVSKETAYKAINEFQPFHYLKAKTRK